MIKTSALQFSYQPGRSFRYPDLECPGGGKLLIKGKSGCGKTTLLHLLSGVLKPGSGTVAVNSTDLSSLNGKAMDHFRGQYIGLIPQRFHFIPSVSVEDNIRLPAYFSDKTLAANRLLELCDQLSIRGLLGRKPGLLSPGEQQRVAIARALAHAPSVVLADEPTSSLDDDNAREVLRLLEQACQMQQTALIVVTHDNRLESHFTEIIQLS